MISRVERRGFRLFREVSVATDERPSASPRAIGPFQLRVGPNGAGTSSFLDVIAIL